MMTDTSSEAPKGEKKLAMKSLVMEEEKKLDQVKEYILSHPRATVAQIAEANEVSANRLFDWIREERLEFSDDSEHAWFKCAKCGIKIKSGIYCFSCRPK
jgi:phage antirepressor YoqD-like protein